MIAGEMSRPLHRGGRATELAHAVTTPERIESFPRCEQTWECEKCVKLPSRNRLHILVFERDKHMVVRFVHTMVQETKK